MPKSGKKKKSAKEDIYTKPLTALQRSYFQEYTKAQVDPIDSVRRGLKNCLEGERGPVPLEKLVLEPPKPPKAKPLKEDVVISDKPPPLLGVAASACLPPLCIAIKSQSFVMIKEISFWGFPLSLHAATKFADMLTDMKYPVQKLEFTDCDLCPESINRLALSFVNCELLKSVSFDYNTLDIKMLPKLLDTLSQCHKLLEISLCYCDLDSSAGKMLGRYSATQVVRNLFIDGNDLGFSGISDFFREIMSEFDKIDAELEAIAAAEAAAAETAVRTMDIDGSMINLDPTNMQSMVAPTVKASGVEEPQKKKKKKKRRSRSRKKKMEEVIPPNGPWMRKVHLADTFGGFSQMEHYHITEKSSPESFISSQALDCIKLCKTIGRFILKCPELEEIDLYNDWMGNGGGAVLLDVLQKREAAELPRIGMRINRGVDGALLKKLFKIASGVKKKKKRRKSAKKK